MRALEKYVPQSIAREKVVHWWYRMPVIVFVLGMLSIAMLIFIHHLSERQLARDVPFCDAAMWIQVHATRSHLWLEEFITGDTTADIEEVWAGFEQSIALASAILKGGELEHGYIIQPLKDPELRTKVEEVQSLLVELKSIALQRYQRPETAKIGSTLDQRFDAVFNEFLGKSNALTAAVRKRMAYNQARSQRLFWIMLLAWIAIIIIGTTGLWSRERRRKQAEKSLSYVNRALQALSACNKAVVRATDETSLLNDMCRIIVGAAGYRLAWVGFAEQDEDKTVQPVVQAGFEEGYLDTVNITWGDAESGRGPTGTAIRTGKPAQALDILTDPNYEQWRAEARKRGYGSSISLPLIADGVTFGALNVYAEEARAFNPEEERLLTELANDLAFGISTLRVRAGRRRVEEELAKSKTEWEHAMDFFEDAIYLIDMEDRVVRANRAFYKLTGLTPEQTIGQDITSIMHPKGEPVPCPVCKTRQMRKDAFITMEVDHPDNPTGRSIEAMVRMIRNEQGDAIGVLMGIHDLSRQREIEEELRKHRDRLEELVTERTQELTSANKELESFCYSVSHDLRAPLRSITGFSQALLEDNKARLDDMGKDYLHRVCTASRHMGMLIDDLLLLSRVTLSEMRREPVDITALAKTIAAELKKTQPQRQVEFVIQEDLVDNGDVRLLQVVLENLLGNAWKFTSKQSRAKIAFGITKIEGKPAYFVSDDGAGFDIAYADKLFVPFQRLHSTDEFEGTGIGLATVQRIIHRHGGRVWAEGTVGKEATFYFTL